MSEWRHRTPQSPLPPERPAPVGQPHPADWARYLGAAAELSNSGFRSARAAWSVAALWAAGLIVISIAQGVWLAVPAVLVSVAVSVRQALHAHRTLRQTERFRRLGDG